MSFKWISDSDNQEEVIDTSIPSFDGEDIFKEDTCHAHFTGHSPDCQKPSKEATETEVRLKACWDNIHNLRLSSKCGCYKKEQGGQNHYYNFGQCPKCEDFYITKVPSKECKFEELKDLCRSCDEEGTSN